MIHIFLHLLRALRCVQNVLTINKGLATLVSLWLALTNLWRFTPPRLPSVGPRIIYKGYFIDISVPTHRRPHTP